MKKYPQKFSIPTMTAIFLALLWSCSSDNSDDTGPTIQSFDREAMLKNWADNIIVPSFQAFGVAVDDMKTASDNFETTPSESNFNILQEEWEGAYLSWQKISMFITGPIEDAIIIDSNRGTNFMNTYPANTNNINSFINSGSYDLTFISTFSAQGFPALDYLLHGLAESDTDILAFYTTNSNSQNYLNYLTDVIDRINTLSDQVVSQWEGDFRGQFVANSGSSATSSTNRLVNDYIFYIERLFRDGKIGIPSGVRSGGVRAPEKVEGFYRKNLSKALFHEALNATQNFFIGGSGQGLDDYLNFVSAMREGEDLTTLINNQFNAIRNTSNGLDDDFYSQIMTNNAAMLSVFDQFQRQTVFLKSDMVSALNISLDFVDSDGD